MPCETAVQKIIKKWYAALRFDSKYDDEFYAALETVAVDPAATVENYDNNEPDGVKNFLHFLYFCEKMHADYQAMGIDENIFFDTVYDLVRWTDVWSKLKGRLHLSEVFWLKFSFTLKLFKLGRLQFERAAAMADIPPLRIKKGEPVLAIHIPADEPLTQEVCQQSLAQAKAFFAKFYPDFHYLCFTCHSWLLDPTLADILPAKSNILAFQKLFQIVNKDPSFAIFRFVLRWDITPEQIATAESKTSLAKAIKEQALGGREFYEGYGLIERT